MEQGGGCNAALFRIFLIVSEHNWSPTGSDPKCNYDELLVSHRDKRLNTLLRKPCMLVLLHSMCPGPVYCLPVCKEVPFMTVLADKTIQRAFLDKTSCFSQGSATHCPGQHIKRGTKVADGLCCYYLFTYRIYIPLFKEIAPSLEMHCSKAQMECPRGHLRAPDLQQAIPSLVLCSKRERAISQSVCLSFHLSVSTQTSHKAHVSGKTECVECLACPPPSSHWLGVRSGECQAKVVTPQLVLNLKVPCVCP